MTKQYSQTEQRVINHLGQWDDDWIISTSYDPKSHGEVLNFCIHVETSIGTINCTFFDVKTIKVEGNWLVIEGCIF